MNRLEVAVNLNKPVDVNHSGTGAAAELQRALAERLPHGIHAHFSSTHDENFALHADELGSCGRFSGKRIGDFVLGRYNAVKALQTLGVPRQPIPMGSSREPLWPGGVIGSISHTENLAGAIVASDQAYGGLGLDIEHIQKLDDIASQFCTGPELAYHREFPAETEYLNVVFGAKEAIYKCVWPAVRCFISFQDVRVALDMNRNRFHIAWHSAVGPELDRVHGFWVSACGYAAAVAILERTADHT